ncbi:hypothetical protein RP20_CCG016025 [Aedes albopictus]|nr:hypothetical protein RP20_CCG016025 [Aedes albopictus]
MQADMCKCTSTHNTQGTPSLSSPQFAKWLGFTEFLPSSFVQPPKPHKLNN